MGGAAGKSAKQIAAAQASVRFGEGLGERRQVVLRSNGPVVRELVGERACGKKRIDESRLSYNSFSVTAALGGSRNGVCRIDTSSRI